MRKMKDWAFLVYIAGDNDLSDAGLRDLSEMCKVRVPENVYVGVELDTYGEHTGSIRYEISNPYDEDRSYRTVMERLEEKDTGDPKSLTDFLIWGMQSFPARRRVLVVWGHGTGFRSITRDVAMDVTGGSLSIPEVRLAIDNAFKELGKKRSLRSIIPKDGKFDVLGFDACLMSMLEVAHHLRTRADILVGSQQREPGDGWPYDEVLKAFGRTKDPERLAERIVLEYIRWCVDHGFSGVTQSALRLENMEELARDVGALGRKLVGALGNDPQFRGVTRSLRRASLSFDLSDYVDLYDLADKMTQCGKQEVIKAAGEVKRTLKKAVIKAGTDDARGVLGAEGVSVWFPSQGWLYDNHRVAYRRLDFVRPGAGWIEFLDAYHS